MTEWRFGKGLQEELYDTDTEKKLIQFWGEEIYSRIKHTEIAPSGNSPDKLTETTYYGVRYKGIRQLIGQNNCIKIPSNSIDASNKDGWYRDFHFRAEVDNPFLMIEVTLESEYNEKKILESDVMILQHFFIRAERILRRKKNKIVYVITNQNSSEDNFRRIETYLFHQHFAHDNILVLVKNHDDDFCRTLTAPFYFNHLLPLIRFTEHVSTDAGRHEFSYTLLMRTIASLDKDWRGMLECCLTLPFKDNKKPLFEDDKKLSIEDQWKLTLHAKFGKGRQLSLEALGWMALHHFSKDLKGTSENRIYSELRTQLFNKAFQLFGEYIGGMNLLTFMIFSMMIGASTHTKDILSLKKNNAEEKLQYDLNEQLIHRIVLDAQAYAQSIYELIENGCLHSRFHFAYFSARLHFVRSGDEGTKIAAKGKMRRSLLEARCEEMTQGINILLKEDSLFYLELQVLDDAFSVGQEEDEPLGMTETFINNKIRQGAQIDADQVNLKHLYLDNLALKIHKSEDRIKQVIHHYGLPLCSNMVRANSGILYVQSPLQQRTEFYFQFLPECENSTLALQGKMNLLREKNCEDIDLEPGSHYYKMNEPSSISFYRIMVPLTYHEIGQEHFNPVQMSRLFSLKDLSVKRRTFSYPTLEVREDIASADQAEGQAFRLENGCLSIYPARIDGYEDKIGIAEDISDALWDQFFEKSDRETCIFQIGCASSMNFLSIEILSKAVFSNIARNYQVRGRLLIAMYFESTSHITDFIRNFSVFYISRSGSTYFQNAHIALCGENEELHIPEVKCYLSGAQFNTVYESAEIFMYYNAETAIKLRSQLKSQYLHKTLMEGEVPSEQVNAPIMFPFDVYLTWRPFDKRTPAERTSEEPMSCWFLMRMKALLERDFTKESLGCKIENIYVRLGSKMHMHGFYVGELLFHNISIIHRFAYMVVRDLINGGDQEFFIHDLKNLLLIGYEGYSSLLMESIASIIQELYPSLKIHLFTLTSIERGRLELVPHKRFSTLDYTEQQRIFQDAMHLHALFVLPIGTTLSTFYMMAAHLNRFIRERYMLPNEIVWKKENARYILLIEVSDQNNPEATGRYWTLIPQKRQLRLKPENSRKTEARITAAYYLMCYTTWIVPDKANEEDEQLLSYVDKGSVLLNTTYLLENSLGRGFLALIDKTFKGERPPAKKSDKKNKENLKFLQEENDKKLEALRGCITYGHINNRDSHHMYTFDLGRYLHHLESGDLAPNLEAWCEAVRGQINGSDQYNIIVTPLDVQLSPFVQMICDKIFMHSAQLLNIQIIEATVEEVRTRFSYITKALKDLRIYDPTAHVNIYFVDHEIVTGNTLRRAQELIRMLMPEEEQEQISIFSGVFVLLNRSSYSTIQNILPGRLENFFAYAHLNVPNYNMIGGRCPACNLVDQYHRLKRMSVTRRFEQHYSRLSKKHQLRTLDEYEQWQNECLFNSRRAFLRLRQWLYSQNLTTEDKINLHPDRDVQIVARSVLNCKEQYAQMLTQMESDESEMLSQLTLEGCRHVLYLDEPGQDMTTNRREAFLRVWRKYVLAETAHQRIMSTHRCFMQHEWLWQSKPNHNLEAGRAFVYDLLQRPVKGIRKSDTALTTNTEPAIISEQTANQNVEYLISNMKALARPVLSRYHDIAEAVFVVYNEIADCLFNDSRGRREGSYLLDTMGIHYASPLIQYQLHVTLLHQIASMQGRCLLQFKNVQNCYTINSRLRAKFSERDETHRFYMSFPTIQQVMFVYEDFLKWMSLSSDEEQKCFILRDEYSVWNREDRD